MIGFFPTSTPWTFKYSFAAEAKSIPGLSLLPKVKGRSIDPVEIITSFARMYQSFCLGVNSFGFSM